MPGDEGYPGMPRWVKIFGIILSLLVLLALLLVVFLPGEHGPGRHGAANPATDGGADDDLTEAMPGRRLPAALGVPSLAHGSMGAAGP